MSDNSDTRTEPAAKKRRAARRNYVAELAELQGRVDMAVKLLRKAASGPASVPPDPNWGLVDVAIETLEEK